MQQSELTHLKRVIETTTTSYGVLRDKYNVYARRMDLLILVLSAIMCATIFMDTNILLRYNIDPCTLRIILGSASLLVFILSIWQSNVKWKQKSNLYSKAFNDVLILRAKLRDMDKFGCEDDVESIKILCHQLTVELAKLPPIPDRQFLVLKAAHKRKVALSRYIDECSGMPYMIIWLSFSIKVIFRRKKIKDVIK
jgi:hypothetical protein